MMNVVNLSFEVEKDRGVGKSKKGKGQTICGVATEGVIHSGLKNFSGFESPMGQGKEQVLQKECGSLVQA